MDPRPARSLDLTREDPLSGKPWDLSKATLRRRVEALVRDTEPFMVIVSPLCALFCGMQKLSKDKHDEAEFQERLTAAKNHVWFCTESTESR